ncbi:MAG: hypothetical protein H6833_10875 [Planctomycetes bacterium]|nr:hypothetical protein [Planctomycetota bacterium]
MPSRSTVLSLLTLLATPALLGAQADPRTAWREFTAAHGSTWRAVWNDATSTPESVYGPGLPLGEPVTSLESARHHAETLLLEQRALLGTGNSQLSEQIGQKVLSTYVFVYRQEHQGLEVIGGRADVRIHERGRVSLFGSRCIPVPESLSLVPTISSATARSFALRSLELDEALAEPNPRGDRLVLFGDPNAKTPVAARLAWEVEVRAHLEHVEGLTYVDAHDGTVITFQSAIHECSVCESAHAMPTNVTGNVQGWTNVDKLPNAALVNVPLQGMKVQVVGGGFATCDANGDFDIPHAGTTPVSVRITMEGEYLSSMTAEQGTRYDQTFTVTPGTPLQVQIFTAGAAQFDRSQTTAFWHIDQVNRFVQGYLGPLPALINGVSANVNRASSCNAVYSTLSNSVTFYHASGGCPNTAYNSVVTHEWGHGLDESFGGINRTDGQSEGSADIISILYNDDPIIGPDFLGPGMPVRTALNTLTYPQSGSVHQMGEPWMGWCWDVRQGLGGTLGSAAGLQRARELFLGVFVTNPSSHPNAVLNVFILDDDDGNLDNGTPSYDVLEAAAIYRHFPYPQRTSGTIDLYGAGCPGSGNAHVACFEQNAGQTLAGYSNLRPFLIQLTATSSETLLGYEMLTSSTTGTPVTANTYVYRSQGGMPEALPLRTSTMLVGNRDEYYRTHMTPFTVTAGEVFFVGFDASRDFHVPQTLAGTSTPYLVDLGFGWFGPFNDPMAVRGICPTAGGGATPELSVDGVPTVGQATTVNLSQAAANTTAFLSVGVSDALWLGLPLPIDLTSSGATGCSVLCSWDIPIPVPTDAYGFAALTLPTPNDPNLLWLELFQQWAVFDPTANALGLTTTQAARGVIGM